MLLIGLNCPEQSVRAETDRLTFAIEPIEPAREFANLSGEIDLPDEGQEQDTVEISPPIIQIPADQLLLSGMELSQTAGRFVELFTRTRGLLKEIRPLSATSIDTIPIIRDQKVDGHIRYFHIAIRDRFEQWLIRLAHYKPHVERIFSEFNLPNDLVFLSLVESGFNPHAYSRARATGPWQFMKGTAKLYGLRVDRYVDERRDPIKSTVAAARYLRDLYDLFGTWPLAMAAYNAGEGKVMRALRKARAEDYWEIARTKHIRRETKEYVPRFMAAAIIAKNPVQYGFSDESPPLFEFEEMVIERAIPLQTLSEVSGVSLVELRRLNPELRLGITPPDDRHYILKVPVGTKELVVNALSVIPTWRPSARTIKQTEHHGPGGRYKVQAGDSLWTISKRLHLSVKELQSRNKFTDRPLKPGEWLTIGPSR